MPLGKTEEKKYTRDLKSTNTKTVYTLLRVAQIFCALCWLNENAKKASRDTLGNSRTTELNSTSSTEMLHLNRA